jgi:hypothetical protein
LIQNWVVSHIQIIGEAHTPYKSVRRFHHGTVRYWLLFSGNPQTYSSTPRTMTIVVSGGGGLITQFPVLSPQSYFRASRDSLW